MSFWIVTDSCADLPLSYLAQNKMLSMFPLSYQIDGQSYISQGEDEDTISFYEKLRAGKVSTTSQINIQSWKDNLMPILAQGHDILLIAFSSGLSGTYNAAVVAARELQEKCPGQKIYVIDSLSASLGEGLVVHYTINCRDNEKMTIEETRDWITSNLQHFCQWFTVDDLMFLKRGGRISATSAFVGGALKIKPVMHVDEEGHLTPVEKVQGRKRSLHSLVERIQATGIHVENQTIFISHGDCPEDAQWAAETIKKELNPKDVLISMVGPVIGSHSGPGTLAIFWFGTDR